MRKISIASLALLAAFAGTALSSANPLEPRATQPKVACTKGIDYAPQFRAEPGNCRFTQRRQQTDAASIFVETITWRKWGEVPAVGRGKVCDPMAPTCEKVVVKLRRIVSKCGREVYAKAVFRYPSTGFISNPMPLNTC